LGMMEPNGEPVLYSRVGERVWPDLPIAVLMNEQSNSAAETLALGLEELTGAALVGAATSGGLNTLRMVDLHDGYKLVLPDKVSVGPRTLAPRPGYKLEPTVAVPNPSADDVRALGSTLNSRRPGRGCWRPREYVASWSGTVTRAGRDGGHYLASVATVDAEVAVEGEDLAVGFDLGHAHQAGVSQRHRHVLEATH